MMGVAVEVRIIDQVSSWTKLVICSQVIWEIIKSEIINLGSGTKQNLNKCMINSNYLSQKLSERAYKPLDYISLIK